ncbi:MAG: hypothetical protein HY525_05460 [Betaproteobacteria bacterium]|nr:hypothetical protein [Betaproteobacteria bacterium]
MRRNSYLSGYMIDFMQLFAPVLKKSDLDKAVAGQRVAHTQGSLPPL